VTLLPDIETVVASVRYEKPCIDELRCIFSPAELIHCDKRDTEKMALALAKADVAIIGADLDQRHLDAPRLKWVHCDHAGLERSARPEVFENGLLVTGSAGRSAPALAEHALFFMLALTYRVPDLYRAQQKRRWGIPNQRAMQAMHGSTLGILGLGHTGVSLATRARAFGMRVLAYRKQNLPAPECVDVQYCAARGETPDALLEESDYVVLAMRLSDATRGIIGARRLQRMKSSAFVINVARGGLVDEDALIRALKTGGIAGAGLDTFAIEPLPQRSSLWRAPNTLITPHFTPVLKDRTERSLEIIRENAARYREGRPLLNALTEEDVYTPVEHGPPQRSLADRLRSAGCRLGVLR